MDNHILLVHTRFDPIAWLIRLYTHSFYNHCAWILNSHLIVESTRGGIKINHINKYRNPFLYGTKEVYIKKLYTPQRNLINNLLTNQVGNVNYIRRFFSFICIACNKKPSTSTCSNFIAKECIKLGINFNPLKGVEFITPQDIEESSEVDNG